MEKETKVELEIGENHPMTPFAMRYIKANITPIYIEAISSLALSGDRAAAMCLHTYTLIEKGKPVGERCVLGLAWYVKELVDGAGI